MIKIDKNIIIVEPSYIVAEGLSIILSAHYTDYRMYTVFTLAELQQRLVMDKPEFVLINPACIQNQVKEFQLIKKEQSEIYWIGVLYSIADQQLTALLDGMVYINDTPEKIIALIRSLKSSTINDTALEQDVLSEREADVLKLLVNGLSNKEIADKLNISIHTVISHRKNISIKTGIKSQSGLTIYAITQKLISLEGK